MSNFVGQMMGRYQIVEQLGEGGMATVYKGYDTTLQRNVAIKVIKSDRTADTSFRKRFEREARALAQLSHPHIVHINDFGEQGGLAYLVMDYMSGGTLKIKMGRHMPYLEAARLLMPIAQALGFAHQHKIVHRDVKPANILLTDTGIPMLSDFGIAKLLEAPSETLDLTSAGMGVGTPAYMAPEQAGSHFDHRADIYALGIVFYELVTGRRPYDADTPLATLMKHATDPLPAPRNFVPSLPDAVEQIIYKALAKNPNERFQTMEEFAQQLEQIQFGNLQPTFARVSQPDAITRMAPQGPRGSSVSQTGATLMAPGGGYPPAYTPPPHTPTPPPILNMSQETSYAPYPQQNYRQPYAPTPMPGPYIQPQKKSSTGRWIAIILAVIAVGVILLVIAAGGLYYFWPAIAGTAAPLPVSGTGDALNQKMTVLAGEWGTVTAQAQGTAFALGESTRQVGDQAAAATQVVNSTTQTVVSSTQQAASLAADTAAKQTAVAQDAAAFLKLPRLAFFDNSNIWSVGLDGKNLIQLTQSGGDKRNLRWMPDGKSLYYISGKCIQAVDMISKVETKLTCFNFVQKVTGFEISPDGKYFGVLADDNLYLGEYNLDAMKKIFGKSDLSSYAKCGYLSGVRFFHLLGDDSKVAITALAPGEDVVRIHNQSCVSHNTNKLDEFPAERFRPFKFNDNPVIYNFAWNGIREYAMTTNYRQHSLGYFYLYNNETKLGEQSKPVDSDCCYSSPAFSYDGSYLTFGFINLDTIATDNMKLYAVPFSDLGAGKKFDPIPLPADMLKGSSAAPQPVIYLPQQ